MKFSNKKPEVITKNMFDYVMFDLKREFDKFILINAVVNSYSINPCKLTKQRINTLNNPN